MFAADSDTVLQTLAYLVGVGDVYKRQPGYRTLYFPGEGALGKVCVAYFSRWGTDDGDVPGGLSLIHI